MANSGSEYLYQAFYSLIEKEGDRYDVDVVDSDIIVFSDRDLESTLRKGRTFAWLALEEAVDDERFPFLLGGAYYGSKRSDLADIDYEDLFLMDVLYDFGFYQNYN